VTVNSSYERDLYAANRKLADAEQTAKHLEKMAFQWQAVALESQAHIAQLERIRDAAAAFVNEPYAEPRLSEPTWTDLVAALEEK